MTLGSVFRAVRRAVRRPTPCECPAHAACNAMGRTRAALGWGPPIGSPTLPAGYVTGRHTWDLLGYRYVCPGGAGDPAPSVDKGRPGPVV